MRVFLTFAMLVVSVASLRADDKEKELFGGFAYSTKTGEYWFAYGLGSKEEVEKELTKRADDKFALTVVVVKNNYMALAQSKDKKAFGVGEADTPREAEEKALAAARKQTKQKVSLIVVLHAAQGVGGDAYSCIAYSPSTGRYGASVAKASKSEAEVEAVEKCMAPDAKVVATARKGECCALALGKDTKAYGAAVAATEKEAHDKALEECRKKTTDCRIVTTMAAKK